MEKEFYSLDEIDIKEFDLIDSFKLENFLSNLDALDYFNSSFDFGFNNQSSKQNPIENNKENTNNSSKQETFNLNSVATNQIVKQKQSKLTTCDKPPEPYADIIAKAILSSSEYAMQLKDIYSYVDKNYPTFTSRVETAKWKSAIRHNLSSQKFFVKTSNKNAQGHFWTIESSYLKVIKQNQGSVSLKKTVKTKRKQSKWEKKTNDSLGTSPRSADDSAFFSSNDNDYSQNSLTSPPSYKFLHKTVSTNYEPLLPLSTLNSIDTNSAYYFNYSNNTPDLGIINCSPFIDCSNEMIDFTQLNYL